jgi:hypothetical protein
MYAGVEGREPFAATMVLEHSLQYNPADLMNKSLGKIPLRKLAADLIGNDFAYSPKVGFPVDIKKVLYNEDSKDRYENYAVWNKENLKLLRVGR